MQNTIEKKTQAQMFVEIRDVLQSINAEKYNGYIDFLNDRVSLLATQAAKAKARKAKKAQEKPEDELYAAVAAQLGEKLKTREDIMDALEVEFPEITPAKITNRLSKLVKTGVAGKMSINVGQGKRVMAYALAEYMPSEDEE